jgi:hypothetical protein
MRTIRLSIATFSSVLAFAAACSMTPSVPSTSGSGQDPTGSPASSSSSSPASAGSSRTLLLSGDGTSLTLSGAPANPSYAATYPIAGFTEMTVTANAYGDLTATCATASGAASCKTLPFFSQVGKEAVTVYDPYAKVVMTVPLTVADGGTTAPTPPPSGAGATGTGTGTGTGASPLDAGSGSSSGASSCVPSVSASISGCSLTVGGTTCDCCDPTCAASAIESCLGNAGVPGLGGSSGFPFEDGGIPGLGALEDGGIPGLGSGLGALDDAGIPGLGSGLGALDDAGSSSACSASAVSSAQSQFCAGVDAWLTAHNVSATLDCSSIGTLSFPASLPPASSTGFTCDEITQAAFAQVRSALATCNPCDYIGWDSSAQLQLFDDGVCTIW